MLKGRTVYLVQRDSGIATDLMPGWFATEKLAKEEAAKDAEQYEADAAPEYRIFPAKIGKEVEAGEE